jgi:hypothetical protein
MNSPQEKVSCSIGVLSFQDEDCHLEIDTQLIDSYWFSHEGKVIYSSNLKMLKEYREKLLNKSPDHTGRIGGRWEFDEVFSEEYEVENSLGQLILFVSIGKILTSPTHREDAGKPYIDGFLLKTKNDLTNS